MRFRSRDCFVRSRRAGATTRVAATELLPRRETKTLHVLGFLEEYGPRTVPASESASEMDRGGPLRRRCNDILLLVVHGQSQRQMRTGRRVGCQCPYPSTDPFDKPPRPCFVAAKVIAARAHPAPPGRPPSKEDKLKSQCATETLYLSQESTVHDES